MGGCFRKLPLPTRFSTSFDLQRRADASAFRDGPSEYGKGNPMEAESDGKAQGIPNV